MRHEITLKLIIEAQSELSTFFTDGRPIYIIFSEISPEDGVMAVTKNSKLIELIKYQRTIEDVNRLKQTDLQYIHDELCPLNTKALGTMASKLSLFLAVVHSRLDELKEKWIDRTNLN